jgi:hypothetical protein
MLDDWSGHWLLLEIGHVCPRERAQKARTSHPTGWGGFGSVLAMAYEVVERDWLRLPRQSRYDKGKAEAGGAQVPLQTIGV